MNTIKQTVQQSFHAIEFSDAFALVQLMDDLMFDINCAKAYEYYNSLSDEEKHKYYYPCGGKYPYAKKAYDVLTKLGFVGSGDVDFLPNGTPLKLKR